MEPLALVIALSIGQIEAKPAPASAPMPRLVRGVTYRTVDDEALQLDVCVPAGDGPHPLVVLVHGGAWMAGKRTDMDGFGEPLARRGLACATVSYRLAPAHRFPAQIDDCRYAVQFLREHADEYHIDSGRIGALGLSAGGHLVCLLGVQDERRDPNADDPVLRQSSRVQCVVSYFGPTLIERAPTRGVDTQAPPELFGDAPPDSIFTAASPLTFVSPDDPPFLFVHGDRDDNVPVEHSIWMDDALRKVGVASERILVKGGGHGDFFRTDPEGAYWKRTEDFLVERLKAGAER